jgi:hypothetical protein
MKSNTVAFLTSAVSDDIFISNIAKGEEAALESIAMINIACFDLAFNNCGYESLSIEDKSKLKSQLIEIFDNGHKYWLEYVEHIRKTFMIELSQFGFIMVMNALPDNNDTIKIYEDVWLDALKIVINRIADAMHDSYKKSVNDAELAKAIDYADEKTLAEFFKTFQELQTYFRNDEKYDTEEKLEMHNKMIRIYQQLIQHVDI